jgi:hypothetical protein
MPPHSGCGGESCTESMSYQPDRIRVYAERRPQLRSAFDVVLELRGAKIMIAFGCDDVRYSVDVLMP